MKTSIIAIIGISMVLAFVPFSTAQVAPIDAKAAGEARVQASVAAKAKARQADEAKRIAADKAKVTSKAKAALAKQQKRIAEQKADLEAQAVKNAERQAKEEIKANEVIAIARRDAELKAQAED